MTMAFYWHVYISAPWKWAMVRPSLKETPLRKHIWSIILAINYRFLGTPQLFIPIFFLCHTVSGFKEEYIFRCIENEKKVVHLKLFSLLLVHIFLLSAEFFFPGPFHYFPVWIAFNGSLPREGENRDTN